MGLLSQLAKSNSKKVCPLCAADNTFAFFEDKSRLYHLCNTCNVIFVTDDFWLNDTLEKGHYDKHNNNVEDAGYRHFLGRIIDPLREHLDLSQKSGLDFGCGHGPALSMMLSERGYSMNIYDKFYQTDESVLQQKYDFITCTEVAEHLQNPIKVLEQLWSMLTDNGVLALMTKRFDDQEMFKTWHYKNDITHIVFYSEKTFLWLAKRWQASIVFYGEDIVILKKEND